MKQVDSNMKHSG